MSVSGDNREEEEPRFLDGRARGDPDREPVGKITWSVQPRGNRASTVSRDRWLEHEPERARVVAPFGPALPEARRSGGLAPRFRFIPNPEELEVLTREKKSAAGGALAGMNVTGPLDEAKARQGRGFGRPGVAHDEDVVELHAHRAI